MPFRPNQFYNNTLHVHNIGNRIINMNSTPQPTVGVSTYSINDSNWWEYRCLSGGGPFGLTGTTQNATTFISQTYGTGSSYNALQNTIGSRWQLSGGDGVYSYEVSAFDTSLSYYLDTVGNLNGILDNPIGRYFAWDLQSVTQSYISILQNVDSPNAQQGTGSVTWFINGSAVKTVTIPAGIGYGKYKIVWDSNINMSYVFKAQSTVTTAVYDTLIGTYSVYPSVAGPTTSNIGGPFCFTGFQVHSPTMSLWVKEFIAPVISNFTGNGLSASNYNLGSNPPPDGLQMNPMRY